MSSSPALFQIYAIFASISINLRIFILWPNVGILEIKSQILINYDYL